MSEFVVDDRVEPSFRVNRRSMTDPAVLEEERRRIFDRSWLYVGHETELPERHDFCARKVGGRPVIFLRDTEGECQILINACTHRGAVLCREPRGNGRFFQCFYHAWSYDTAGRLVAMPDAQSYGPNFDKAGRALARPPRAESYRGFWFLSYDPDIVDLATYLGEAREYIDLVCDQSAVGMEIARGTHEYAIAANWKLLVENSIDGYHALPTHQRYFTMVLDAGMPAMAAYELYGADLGHGHAAVVSNATMGRPATGDATAAYEARRAGIVDRVGPERASRMFGARNLFIFPNFFIIDLVAGVTVRTMWPVSPNYMEVTGWELAPADEDPRLRSVRVDNFLTFWGPAGLATPDDVEALEACQQGFAAQREAPWSDISRGMLAERPSGTEELQMRAFWRRWNELMTAEVSTPEPHLPPPTCFGPCAADKVATAAGRD